MGLGFLRVVLPVQLGSGEAATQRAGLVIVRMQSLKRAEEALLTALSQGMAARSFRQVSLQQSAYLTVSPAPVLATAPRSSALRSAHAAVRVTSLSDAAQSGVLRPARQVRIRQQVDERQVISFD